MHTQLISDALPVYFDGLFTAAERGGELPHSFKILENIIS
jgi:hypothetical protein